MDQQRYFPVCVIGSQFMAPYQFDLIVDTNSGGNIVITDINHKILLKVKPCDTTFHLQRMLLHADGTPIVRLRDKIMTTHNKWKVYRGHESTSSSSKIFSTKKPNMIQCKTRLHVFLAHKRSGKHVCDFKIKGSWSKKNCKIYMGDSKSSTTIAQMHKFQKSKKDKFDKDKFLVTIYPNVDYAFVIALIAIIDAMKSIKKGSIVEGAASASSTIATMSFS